MRKITLVGEVPTQPLRLATGDIPVTWNTVPVAPLQGDVRAKTIAKSGRETLVSRECDCWLNCGPCTCNARLASLARRDERRVL